MRINLYFSGFLLVLGVFLVLSGENPLLVWLGLELNLFAFFSFLQLTPSLSIMYLLPQLSGSLLLVMGFVLGNWSLLLVLGLGVKLGVFPFVNWFLSLCQHSSWGTIFLLCTLQKVHVFYLFSSPVFFFSGVEGEFLVCTLIFALFVSVFQPTKFLSGEESSLKLGVSIVSVIDSSLVLVLLSKNFVGGVWYFFWYSTLLLFLVTCVSLTNNKSVWALSVLISSGFPPLPAFFLKINLLKWVVSGSLLSLASPLSFLPYLALPMMLLQFLIYILMVGGIIFRYDLLMEVSWGWLLPVSLALLCGIFFI